MTIGYGVTRPGMVGQLVESYIELRRDSWPPEDAFGYLADQITHVAKNELLRRPEEVMQYITAIAAHCIGEGRLMEWTSPMGFPCVNRYQPTNVEQISIGSGAVRARHIVGMGWGEGALPEGITKAAPNYVHSQDAAHLARTVNIAVNNFGVTDILTVHDCFACHASNCDKLHNTFNRAMLLYFQMDCLAELRRKNACYEDTVPAPTYGDLTPTDIYQFKYAIS
jgi:DNA-directed RNA polymerase